MLSLESHHIVDLYVWVDGLLPSQLPSNAGGRPAVLRDSELVTLLVWNAIVLHQKTMKELHSFAQMYLDREFPCLPKYSAFVDHCHRVTPRMFSLLQQLLVIDEPIKFVDSTMLPVCTLKRAEKHRVVQGIAQFGKNHQGWHFGFKLHAAITKEGILSGLAFTPASTYDAQVLPKILGNKTRVAVGDSHYGASVMRQIIWEKLGTIIIAPPHYKQKKKIMALWQYQLLRMRSKIESVFDILKQHLQLVTSFPRSPFGYLVHYVRILLGYQIMALCAG